MFKLIGIILLVHCVYCWKPSSHPTSFSISQQHPQLGQSHSSVENSIANSEQHTVTYHGNGFLNDHSIGHSASDLEDDLVEPRILHNKDIVYGSAARHAVSLTLFSIYIYFVRGSNSLKNIFLFVRYLCFVNSDGPLKYNL